MTFSQPQTLKSIAELINAKYIGDDNFPVYGTNEIHRVKAGEIVFVNHPKYYDKALKSAATAILIDKEVECPEGKALLISDDPFRDFNKINTHFKKINPFTEELHTVEVGEGTHIHPSAVIGNHVKIGKNCLIYPNVVIGDYCTIGDNVVIQSGTVLGGDAFYYRKLDGDNDRLISVGNVIIENRVEIGNNCTIDRATIGSTVIGKGTKIDNLIQIAHNVKIGEHNVIAAQTGIAGSTSIGNWNQIGGQVGIVGHITIGNQVKIQAQSGINNDTKDGEILYGSPAMPAADFRRNYVHFRNLNGIVARINNLEKNSKEHTNE